MKSILLVVILVLACASCQKKPQEVKIDVPPEEPFQRLAWDAVEQINKSIPNASIKIGQIENRASLPDASLHYFRGALENELWSKKGNAEPSITINGILTQANGQLQFFWKQADSDLSGMSAILWSPPAKEPEKVPEKHDHSTMAHHEEAAIPIPVAYLQSAPLDVNQICLDGQEACEIVVLYADAVEMIDWKNGTKKKMSIENEHFLNTRSRAPSGKILQQGESFLILNNNLNYPLKYDSNLNDPSPAEQSTNIPKAAPGLNTFLLMNGRFYDFEFLNPKGIAVIQDNQTLSIGAGTLTTANEIVGSSLAVVWPAIYTSSSSLPDQPDSIMKFVYENSSLALVSRQQVEGEILDLAVTDLNKDGVLELLATVRTKNQIFIDVLEAF
jgi:hypothetical protein